MSQERPVTSKSRGVCKFYNTPSGCFAGNSCKFLHGEQDKLTPFDKGKTCRFYASGYCKRGLDCWFHHVRPDSSGSDVVTEPVLSQSGGETEEHLCSICFEKPVTYGLLGGCSHIFCIQCIKDWRDPSGKTDEMVGSGVTKKCPMCRAESKFVTPSSHFYADSHPGKATTIEQYKASMARVPCRYFQRSSTRGRYCPFGNDCFYQHLNADGTKHDFGRGVDGMMKRRSRYLDARGEPRQQRAFDEDEAIMNMASIIEQLDFEDISYPFDDDSDPELYEGELESVYTLMSRLEAQGWGVDLMEDEPPQWEDEEPSTTPLARLFTFGSFAPGEGIDAITTENSLVPRVWYTAELGDTHTHLPIDDANVNTQIRLDSILSNPDHNILDHGPVDDGLVQSSSRSSAHDAVAVTYNASSSVDSNGSKAISPEQTGLDHISVDETGQAKQTEEDQIPVIQDTDPPFLTDGRGRVVWSSAGTRGRRGRASGGSSHKASRGDTNEIANEGRSEDKIASSSS